MNRTAQLISGMVLAVMLAVSPPMARGAGESLKFSIGSAKPGQATTAVVGITSVADVESLSLELSYASGTALSLPATNWFTRGAYFPDSPFVAPYTTTNLNDLRVSAVGKKVYISGFKPTGTTGSIVTLTFNVSPNAFAGTPPFDTPDKLPDSQALILSGKFYSKSLQQVVNLAPVTALFTVAGNLQTVPDAPLGVTAIAGNGSATVSFSPPTTDGGSAITSYTVTSAPGNFTASGSASPIVVTGLVNGSAYTFTVKATNIVGAGAASMPSNSVTPAVPVNGVCGSSNGAVLTSAPSAGLCTSGTASAVSGSGPWSWSCTGSNGGTNASCAATIKTWTVTGSVNGTGGNVTCTSPVKHGAPSVCSIAPAVGFQLATLTDNGLNVLAAVAAGTYTISSVTANHAVVASFADVQGPVIGTFTLPPLSKTLTVSGIVLSATDNVAVTGYRLSESATPPSPSALGWSGTSPISFTFSAAGSRFLYAFAKDGAGNVSAVKSAKIDIDTTAPALVLSTLANGAVTNQNTLNIAGTVSDAGGLASLTINNAVIAVNPDGSFSHAITLVPGGNVVTTLAKDLAGNQTSDIRTISLDQKAPKLTVATPADNSKTAQVLSSVTGSVDESSTVVVTPEVGGPQNATMNGTNFSATVNLKSGLNTIGIAATDLAGNSSSAKRSVTYDNTQPTLAVTSPASDVTIHGGGITISGTVTDTITAVATVVITADGKQYTPTLTGGNFSQPLTFTEEKTYPVVVTATDEVGNSMSVTRNVINLKGTIVINGGALFTITPKVTLSLGYYPSAAQMQFNLKGTTWTKPEPFAATKPVALPSGDGQKSVRVRYLDDSGTALGEYASVITLDTKSPTGKMTINGGAKLTNSRTVTVEITAADVTSGISTACYREDALPCVNTDFVPFTASKELQITSPGDGKKKVFATLKDLAGKTSKALKGGITLDTVPPTGSIVINGGKPTTAIPLVALKLKATKAAEMQLSLDGGATWGAWEKFASSKKVTLPAGAGEKVVKVRFRDLAGNESVEYQDSITLQ